MSVNDIVRPSADKRLKVRRLFFLAVWILLLSGVIGSCSSTMRGCSRPATMETDELHLDLHVA